jgi:geranylgeranyl reductase family protein
MVIMSATVLKRRPSVEVVGPQNLHAAEERAILALGSGDSVKTIAIIGGGPAGAMAAQKLARGGARVTVFEERLGWEKPCGGGLSVSALHRYPFLFEAAHGARRAREAEFVASSGASVKLRLRQPMAIYSRAVLNHLLLARAAEAGAEIVADRIVHLAASRAGWRLEGRRRAYQADFIVLAAGARSRLRSLLTKDFQARDFMLTLGYYVPGAEDLLRVQFFEDFEGYAWAFPRPDHLSVGICGKVGKGGMAELRERLGGFTRKFGYPGDNAPVFAHLLPSLTVESWSDLRLAGEGWALAGDSAGLVDPLTGEGIYYAMRSGELLAECLLEDSPATYPLRVWREFAADLAHGARLGTLFYRGNVLGSSLSTRTVEFCGRSAVLMDLLQDLTEGAQPYATLLTRLYGGLAASLFEIAATSLHGMLPNLRSAEG